MVRGSIPGSCVWRKFYWNGRSHIVGPAGRGIEATSVPIKNDTIILIKKEE
jgi:hypothetical protein